MKTVAAMTCLVLLNVLGVTHAEQADRTAYKVRFDLLKTNHIIVQIKVNGKGPFRAIFDTGAPFNLINTKVATESGMVSKETGPGLFSVFGALGPAQIKTLEVGEVKVEDIQAIVMDHPTVELISQATGPVVGVIGYPFFAQFDMTLDYQAKELTLMRNGNQPSDGLKALMTTLMTLGKDKSPEPIVRVPSGQWGLILAKADDAQPGVAIREVLAGSAAAEAGLKPGDRILTLDGRWTDSIDDAYLAAGFVKPGSSAKLVLKRGEKEMEVLVKPRPGF